MSKMSLAVQKAAKSGDREPHAVIPGATPTGLLIPPGLSFDAWSNLGDTLSQIASAHQWWMGDWWRYGEAEYGERASQAVDSRWSFQTWADAGWVSGRIETSRRREVLSWSHHKEVASLEPTEQDEWLERAEAESWTRDELRRAVKTRHLARFTSVDPPAGQYRTIVIDPPWPMEKIEREVRPNQGPVLDYPTMTLEQIAALPIADLATDPGTHVYLWTTHRFLPDALSLFEQWGVSYQCVMTWVKNVGITPYSWMYDTEHVLFGRIGQLPLEQLGLRLSFEAPAIGHSIKPEVFYQRVEQASPGPRLDMFARREREGWAVWGNEVAA